MTAIVSFGAFGSSCKYPIKLRFIGGLENSVGLELNMHFEFAARSSKVRP